MLPLVTRATDTTEGKQKDKQAYLDPQPLNSICSLINRVESLTAPFIPPRAGTRTQQITGTNALITDREPFLTITPSFRGKIDIPLSIHIAAP